MNLKLFLLFGLFFITSCEKTGSHVIDEYENSKIHLKSTITETGGDTQNNKPVVRRKPSSMVNSSSDTNKSHAAISTTYSTCQINFGECKLHNETINNKNCSAEIATMVDMCPNSEHSCCVPNKEIQNNWLKTDDLQCTNDLFGVCKRITEPCGNGGKFQSSSCGGPETRSCCVPDHKKWNDIQCRASFGHCQHASENCNSSNTNVDFCGGDLNRICCSPNTTTVNLWKQNDTECNFDFGKCQNEIIPCDGTIKTEHCGGPSSRKCCIPDFNDEACNNQYGTCQNINSTCKSGKTNSKMCGGPSERICCLPDRKSWNDDKCSLLYGKCQHVSDDCPNATVKADFCDGGKNRVCCPTSEKVKHNWEQNDVSCVQVKGKCQHKLTSCENQKHEAEHSCGGPDERVCCLPKDHIHDDSDCLSKNGKCQAKNDACSNGKFIEAKCKDSFTRSCCVVQKTIDPHKPATTTKKVITTSKTSPRKTSPRKTVKKDSVNKENKSHETNYLVPFLLITIVVLVFFVFISRKKLYRTGMSYMRHRDKTGAYETKGLLTSNTDNDGKRDLQVQLTM